MKLQNAPSVAELRARGVVVIDRGWGLGQGLLLLLSPHLRNLSRPILILMELVSGEEI